MLSAEGEIYLEYLEEFYTCREYWIRIANKISFRLGGI